MSASNRDSELTLNPNIDYQPTKPPKDPPENPRNEQPSDLQPQVRLRPRFDGS